MSRKNRALSIVANPLYNSNRYTSYQPYVPDGKRGTAATIVYINSSKLKNAGNDALVWNESYGQHHACTWEYVHVVSVVQTTKSQLRIRPGNVVQLLVVGWLTHHVRGEHTMKDRLAKKSWMLQATLVHQLRNVEKILTKWLKQTVPLHFPSK